MPAPDGPQFNAVKHLINVNRQTYNQPDTTDDEVKGLGGRVGAKIDSTLESNFGNLGIMWPYVD
jgi:hypothetical protein